MPSPKELDNALTLSADRARRMAEAFGLKVPGIAPKPAKARGWVFRFIVTAHSGIVTRDSGDRDRG